MNYLKVPDSSVKLTDGSVVMLARFPGTKWVVRYGWYDYSGRRGMGWYFSSIPAQTVIPVTSQDLQLIVLIDQGHSTDIPSADNPPSPPVPGPHPGPAPCPPGPKPPFNPDPGGLYPCPVEPGTTPPESFTKNDKYLLDSSWITLPSIRYRDALSTICNIPDGKIVKIVNVDGKTRYYSWSAPDNRWYEKFFENDTEQLLADYYDKHEIDEMIGAINASINSIEASVNNLNRDLSAEIQIRTSSDNELSASISELSRRVDDYSTGIGGLFERVAGLEAAVFSIQKIVADASNTVLVSSEGTLKDSGVSIGDSEIGEPSPYANEKVLATEKAVAKLVEENTTQWSLF